MSLQSLASIFSGSFFSSSLICLVCSQVDLIHNGTHTKIGRVIWRTFLVSAFLFLLFTTLAVALD